MKFKLITYRNPNDFSFGGWKYEHQSDGGTIIYGTLKKNGNITKYQRIYKTE